VRAGSKSGFFGNVKVVELHIVDLEIFSSRPNYTMGGGLHSQEISIV
jgi:hypothetical protein